MTNISEREKLLAFLFERDEEELMNIKFFRGTSVALTVEQMCAASRRVVERLWNPAEALVSIPPQEKDTRVSVRDLFPGR